MAGSRPFGSDGTARRSGGDSRPASVIERGHAIQRPWRILAAHALTCDACRPGIETLSRVPDDPRRVDFEVYETLCNQGQELFTEWRGAKDAWLEKMRPHQEQRFMLDAQLWDDGVTADQRAAAVLAMPEDDFRAWLALPDERRHAQLRALEHAHRTSERRPGPETAPGSRGTGQVPPARRSTGRQQRTCPACGGPSSGGFCSRECRDQYGGAPALTPTE